MAVAPHRYVEEIIEVNRTWPVELTAARAADVVVDSFLRGPGRR